MTVKVSICNTDLHRSIVVTQCGKHPEDDRPTGTRVPVSIAPLTTAEFHVHDFIFLEIHERKP